MMFRSAKTLLAIALLSAGTGLSAAAITDAWPLMAFAREADCELTLHGNGRFVELRASGLIPGESLDFRLTNGTMKPLAARVYADGRGEWRKLYVPFRFGQDGGTVAVTLAGSRCRLSASLPWSRGVRTIP